jgi:hypothetical protein
MQVGRLKEAHDAAPSLVERARAVGHPPLLARALYEVSVPGCDAGDPRAATAGLYEAARAAGAAHDDLLAARIYTKLVYCVGGKDMDVRTAEALAEAAEAALARAGTPLELRAQLYYAEYVLRYRAGDLLTAVGFAELELMSYRRLAGDDSAQAALGFGDLGDVLQVLGAYRASLAAYARALPILERTRGPTHPQTAAYLSNMAGAAAEAGDLDGAAAAFERAIAMAEQNYGPESAPAANMISGLAEVRDRQGQLDAAWELAKRARAIDEKTLRGDHPHLAYCLALLADIAFARGELADAQALTDRALAMLIAAYGPDHRLVAGVYAVQAEIARKRHDLAGARQLVERAVAARRKAVGARHPSVASTESSLASILLEAGDARAALPLLEDSLRIQENARREDAGPVVMARTLLAEALVATGDPGRAIPIAERAVAAAGAGSLRADRDALARFALAQALASADRPRALELARQARGLLLEWHAAGDVARIDRWLSPGKR